MLIDLRKAVNYIQTIPHISAETENFILNHKSKILKIVLGSFDLNHRTQNRQLTKVLIAGMTVKMYIFVGYFSLVNGCLKIIISET